MTNTPYVRIITTDKRNSRYQYVDQTKVQKLSNEVAELQAELLKKRDKYLLQCRQEFGDQGWQCPGKGW